MKRLAILLLACLPVLAQASSGGVHLDKANIDIADTASLQRGAKLFVNYCLSCHSASYMRYNRVAVDLGLSEDDVLENLVFTDKKIGDTMTVALGAADAKAWFGTKIPDLSVIVRAKGAGSAGENWLYTYLKSFYQDGSRPFGTNNVLFPSVGMPNVLSSLQGEQKAVMVSHTDEHGIVHESIDGLELVSEGSMNEKEFDGAVRDLVAFLSYVSEPGKLQRQELGVKVLLFFFVFFIVALLLKKEYWKDIH